MQKKGGDKVADKIYCNVCGRELHMKNGILLEDAFEARKQWGYFSNKDAKMHSFTICEECYDKFVSTFAIPLKETDVIEL